MARTNERDHSTAKRAELSARRQVSKRKTKGAAASESGRPGGGKGRRDIVEPNPAGIRIDRDITEGHPGYEESGRSEIMPIERLAAGEKTKGKGKQGKRSAPAK